MPLAAHGVTHPGRRKTNEDAMLVDPARGLFAVADGMGGHNAGEVAAAIAVGTLSEFVTPGLARGEGALADGLRLANEQVLRAAERESGYSGMGTTVVVALVTDDRVWFGSVGDSRIYLWRGGALAQLTTDDSWLSRVLPDDAITAEDAQRHPMRHVLTKVVGLRQELDPAVGARDLAAGDVLLLCSDGVHGTVSDEAIAGALGSGAAVDQIGQRLVEEALAGGGTDNATAVVIKIT